MDSQTIQSPPQSSPQSSPQSAPQQPNVFRQVYSLSKVKQLVDLNGEITNFDISFRAKTKNGESFDVLVLDQTTLDNSSNLEYKKASGEISGHLVQDKNVYQNYFLILKADNPCQCEVEIVRQEIPRAQPQNSGVPNGVLPNGNTPGSLMPLPPSGPQGGLQGSVDQSSTNWPKIIITALVFAGIGYAMYYFLKKRKDTDDGIPSPTASPARSVSEKNDFHPKNNLMDRLKSLHLS